MAGDALARQRFDIAGLHHGYGRGLGPAAVIAEAYRRIDAVGDPGIFLHRIDRDAAIAEALALGPFDPVGKPLWGVPFAIKDNIDAAGAPTTAACPAFAYAAAEDAFAVAALRRAGAILIGKTNLDQFATGLVGLRSPYPPPRNALDPAMVPGGSSSGSAVAVAHGIVSFALGTDTAGSGRVPAALNNIVGLKPTRGAISASGVVPACRSLDTVSVFALTVEDAYRVFLAAAHFDPADAYARPLAVRPLGPPPPRLRVGIPDAATRAFFGDDRQAASFSAAVDAVTALGGTIVEVDFTPFFEIAEMLYAGPWVAERYAVVEALLRSHPDQVLPVIAGIIGAGERWSAADAFRAFYRLKARRRQAAPTLGDVDLLCVPSIPTPVTVAEVDADPLGPNARLGTYTNFVNLMDLCAVAVPVAPRTDGRPGSVTLIATIGEDSRIAAVAAALQRRTATTLGATGWSLPTDAAAWPLAAEAHHDDELPVAVVGAHMSGLTLNGDLTRRGGRFLRAARTAPTYRLYRLPGGPPPRPGLLRAAAGAAIAVEVWALPLARVGDFLATVPPPLCIGTLALEDGTEVKGFLCEPSAADGADDITAHGGWRAYLGAVGPRSQATSPATPQAMPPALEKNTHAQT